MNITTTYKTNENGTGQILAKGGGKQRTSTYRPEFSVDTNHGLAAGELARVLFQGEASRAIAADLATHKVNANGTHTFTIKA